MSKSRQERGYTQLILFWSNISRASRDVINSLLCLKEENATSADDLIDAVDGALEGNLTDSQLLGLSSTLSQTISTDDLNPEAAVSSLLLL